MRHASNVGFLLSAVLIAQGASAATGALIPAEALPATARQELAREIAEAKANRSPGFAALQTLRQRLPTLDANKRGPLAAIAPLLRPVGADAVLPLIEAIAFNDARGDLTDSAWLAWRIGILEALGQRRDARSKPVFAAMLQSGPTDFKLVRAAAEGYGKLGTDDVARHLVALASPGSGRRLAVLAGMGSCRRAIVARSLAAALTERPADTTAVSVIRSLGMIGSSWAWKTPSEKAKNEELEVRYVAAEALVGAFGDYKGQVRDEASDALMMVDSPRTPVLIGAAKTRASIELASALDALARRFDRNPAR